MNKKENMKFDVMLTNSNGYDRTVNRYYSRLKLFMNQIEYNVVVSCREYDVANMRSDDLTIEFLDDMMHNTQVPFDKELFDELVINGEQMFEEMKLEEFERSGAV